MPAVKRADLAALALRAGAGKFSFDKAELLEEKLVVIHCFIKAFSLINDINKEVAVVLDRDIMTTEWVNYHPLYNAASTTIRVSDLLRFLHILGRKPAIIECGAV